MLDAALRPLKDAALRPLARAAGSLNPLVISVAGLLAGLTCAAAAALGAFGPALLAWALNRLLDGLDGPVARTQGRESDLGGFIDIMFDFMVYAAVPLGIAAGLSPRGIDAWPATALLLASFYINAASWLFLAALIEKRAAAAPRSTAILMPEGLIAGTETLLFFSVFLLFPAAAPRLFTVMAVLVLVTALQRMLGAHARLG
jgi:phosphatidylglycerophosphate synthase